ncbi:hypothetical protein [Roseivirga ehrenbergii]|uniref:hypothetical protein n=1 Tax=Roseivirga ehrenbergii (strain DSM 102268 / JCM 13514 / KCTC 12282 / NCIMB 14502 / KMM 6017) TaxID=279360 RepID=UPI001C8674DA|nr:hypothetical protein [Roseivirga ehrenbergii]
MCLAMTPGVGSAAIDRQYPEYQALIFLAGLSATVEVKRWVTMSSTDLNLPTWESLYEGF